MMRLTGRKVECSIQLRTLIASNVLMLLCFNLFSFGCGEPVHEPVRCAVSYLHFLLVILN